MTQIPPIRLTRAGKGITFCRTRKREGRMTVSASDLRRSNRLRWRRYANSDRTRLWIGRTSGHGSGLLVDGSPRRESPEANANVRRLSRKLCLRESCGSLEAGLEHGIELGKYRTDGPARSFPTALLQGG